jgi:hypothetical protein
MIRQRKKATPGQRWWNKYGHISGYPRWGYPDYDGIYPIEYKAA